MDATPHSEQLEKAIAFYEDFHWGSAPGAVEKKRFSKRPRTAVKIGKLRSVTYETVKNGEHAAWEHEFGEEGGVPPDLAVDPETKALHIVGGSYDVRPEGIVD